MSITVTFLWLYFGFLIMLDSLYIGSNDNQSPWREAKTFPVLLISVLCEASHAKAPVFLVAPVFM